MFCRVCGEDNEESSLYCSRDGQALNSNNGAFTMLAGDISFCKECGDGVSKNDLYCSNCGASLYTIGESKAKNIENVIKEASYSTGFDIKNLLKYSLIAVGVIILISILASNFINTMFVKTLSEEMEFFINQKFISFLDVSTMLNNPSLRMNLISGGQNVFNLSLDGMLFILLLVPISIFIVMGVYIGIISEKKKEKFELKEYIFIGLSYGIIISLLSLLASKKVQLNIPFMEGITDFANIEFVKKYSFFSTLIKSSLLSLFSLGLGSGIYSFFKNFKSKRLTCISIASIIFMISAIFSLIFIVVLSFSEDILYNFVDISEVGALFQLFVYAIIFINIGTFDFSYEGEMMSVSLFKNMDQFKSGFSGIQFIYIGLLISMTSFFFYGRDSKKKYLDMKSLILVPAIFALGLGVLAYLTNITINMNNIMSYEFDTGLISLGFNPISTAVGSFVIAILSTLAGYFLTSQDRSKEDIYE